MFGGDKPTSYEEYLKPQFAALGQGRGRQVSARRPTVTKEAEIFLESDDWQTLLQ